MINHKVNLGHKSMIFKKKARMLKDCNSYKAVFVSLSFTFAERQRICELYVELHKRNDEDVASIILIVVALYRTGR